ncbi:DNA cross-link repair 1A protein [Drosophila guanche]|uniref:Blast:DNA cross-link repair protein SNM1 n=1 Tax=Drosophila guanche TaxID=7266 RepID=A0A3B0K8G3_DROGU|nr:DNA cross-link repair 1A protein [Drosophila guanche]SPP84380.1 blast:DNA cross-link repair protein SNM1 [Drosophila guanche]
MSNVGKIRLKSFEELQASTDINVSIAKSVKVDEKTPEKKKAGKTTSATTTRKTKSDVEKHNALIVTNTTVKRSSKKTTLPGQLRIDSFFKSSSKSLKVENTAQTSQRKIAPKAHKGRKRLFDEKTATTSSDMSKMKPQVQKRVQPPRKSKGKENTSMTEANIVDLCSESESCESDDMKSVKMEPPPEPKSPKVPRIENEPCPPSPMASNPSELFLGDVSIKENLLSQSSSAATKSTSVEGNASPVEATNVITNEKDALASGTPPPMPNEIVSKAKSPDTANASSEKSVSTGRGKRAPKPCPPYKVVEGTHFCVDGFQFGAIPGVTNYFLSHYHADHYIGLTKTFTFPLFMSPTTARLVRAFIKIDDMYIHEIDVDQTIVVENIEITGIEANHCPGALMFFFRLPSGQCILHTGDFRASFEMESLPIFWNNIDIDLLYLDTTYLSESYDFCHQTESVSRLLHLVQNFHERNPGKRILYVCGAYVIGKEKIWLALAKKFCLKVWTEAHRRVAIDCLEWPELQTRMTADPYQANLHVIAMGKVGYLHLSEYFTLFEDQYDMLLAIRPSGWEKKSKPSYGKRISTIGIEYSEHSSYKELERFVRFLKPKRVISTVPVGGDLFVTGKVPPKWHNFKGRLSMMPRRYQPSITTFMATPKRIVPPFKGSGTEMALSPVDEKDSDEGKGVVPDHVTISSSTSEEVGGKPTEEAQDEASKDVADKIKSPVKSKPSEGNSSILLRVTSDASDDWLR